MGRGSSPWAEEHQERAMESQPPVPTHYPGTSTIWFSVVTSARAGSRPPEHLSNGHACRHVVGALFLTAAVTLTAERHPFALPWVASNSLPILFAMLDLL